MVKVRFAPSPTGIPHVGNIRTALFDYFLAKSTGGKFILRLEDTDQARKIEGAEEAIKESLLWLGAEWDEFVVQSERLSEYKNFAQKLVEKGQAIVEEGAIRFLVEKSGSISWTDAIGNKEISYELENVEDFIILKADGYPTYHLANVVDDHLMEITHVIRGEDWIPSTPKHILLYKAFGWEAPVFAHVPNVMGVDGKKLSKRRGAKSVLDFKKEGYLPSALMNYLMLLGWSPKDDREVLSKQEIIDNFSLDKVNVSPAVFDERKLLWMNGEYIRQANNSELKKMILEFDPLLKEFDQELLEKLMEPAKTRMKTLADFRTLAKPFLDPEFSTEPSEIKNGLRKILTDNNNWTLDSIIETIKGFNTNQGIAFPEIYQAIIGQKQGLPLADVFVILGKERTVRLLD